MSGLVHESPSEHEFPSVTREHDCVSEPVHAPLLLHVDRDCVPVSSHVLENPPHAPHEPHALPLDEHDPHVLLPEHVCVPAHEPEPQGSESPGVQTPHDCVLHTCDSEPEHVPPLHKGRDCVPPLQVTEHKPHEPHTSPVVLREQDCDSEPEHVPPLHVDRDCVPVSSHVLVNPPHAPHELQELPDVLREQLWVPAVQTLSTQF